MGLVSVVLFFAILLTYLDDKGKMKNGMVIAFWAIIVFFSLRYNYGNDFTNYQSKYFSICKLGFDLSRIEDEIGVEVGWAIFNLCFKYTGFQTLIFVHTLIINIIFYSLIKKYVVKGWRWYAVMFYLFNTNIFLINLSMLRQGLASALVIYAFFMSYEKKYLKALIFFLLSYSFHKTALLMAPFILLLPFANHIKMKPIIAIVVLVLVALFYMPGPDTFMIDFLLNSDFLPQEYDHYMVTAEAYEKGTGIGIMISVICALFSLYGLRYKLFLDKMFVLLFITSLVFIPLSFVLVMILRLSYYFLTFGIFLFPRLYSNTCYASQTVYANIPIQHKKRLKLLNRVSIGLNSLYLVYGYYAFFYSETYGPYYSDFHFATLC